jgi:uncharacterized protein
MAMQYRTSGKLGVEFSAVGFGSMRWPSEDACRRIIERGIDLGLNYVDTSTGYCNGQSEVWTGRAVKRRRREIYVSNKTQYGRAPKADQVRAAIEKSLEAMELDYLDFYQFWGLDSTELVKEAVKKGGFVEGVRKAQADGLVRQGLGFTFHGPPAAFRAAVDTGEFVSATVSYNLLNRKEDDNIAYAAAKGMAIVIMNPLAGGVLGLAGLPFFDFLREGGPGPANGALRFLLANPSITTGIVGFRAVEEVDQAAAAVQGSEKLGDEYRQGLLRRIEALKLPEGHFCTGCNYCKDCPKGVNVSKFMQAMRDFEVYGVERERLTEWIWSKYPHQDPVAQLDACTACGNCEGKCPQHLKIIETIGRGKAALAAR